MTYGGVPANPQFVPPSREEYDKDRYLKGSYTVANLPKAGVPTGALAWTTDANTLYGFSGTSWAPVSSSGTGPLEINGIPVVAFPNNDTQSIAIGKGAFANDAVSGFANSVAIGYNAMGSVTTLTGGAGHGYDVAVGWNSLPVDQGGENTAVGVNALLSNTTATFNVMVGNDSGSQITTGGSNIGMGHSACGGGPSDGALTGNTNVALGDLCGEFMSGAASDNTFVGGAAGAGTVTNQNTGSSNTAVGWQALNNVSTGGSNVAIGFAAMQGSSSVPLTGSENIAIGANALQNAQGSCVGNVAIGKGAAGAITTGYLNVIIGDGAGAADQTGTTNVIIGYAAGNQLNSSNNVIIGPQVASTTLTSGVNNVLIGTTADIDTAAGGTGNTIKIGAGSTAVISATGTGTPSTSVTTVAGLFGINGAVGAAKSTGWGTPTSPSAQNNYSGSAATLPQTSAAVAQIITVLKAAGFLGT